MLLSWYVAEFDSYNRVYHHWALLLVMTSIWFSVVVVLVEAEPNAEMELQQPLTGPQVEPKPLGRRGGSRSSGDRSRALPVLVYGEAYALCALAAANFLR
jgi:uncharacterized BrkB/YihY/UPF0761 family membrane protein